MDRLRRPLDRRFRAIMFDWDGTAVLDRRRDASELRGLVETLCGLGDPRVTTDAKHVEIGLTDKTDTAREVFPLLASLGVPAENVLVCGDEMGPLGGSPGSDSLMLVAGGDRATAVSVGVEPEGVPAQVLALGGGPARFLELLREQVARRSATS